jgi:hypothetical protein
MFVIGLKQLQSLKLKVSKGKKADQIVKWDFSVLILIIHCMSSGPQSANALYLTTTIRPFDVQ